MSTKTVDIMKASSSSSYTLASEDKCFEDQLFKDPNNSLILAEFSNRAQSFNTTQPSSKSSGF